VRWGAILTPFGARKSFLVAAVFLAKIGGVQI